MKIDWRQIADTSCELDKALNEVVGNLRLILDELDEAELREAFQQTLDKSFHQTLSLDELVVRQSRFLQQAQEFALSALNVSRNLSVITAIDINEPQFGTKHRRTVARRSEKLKAGTEELGESLSAALAAISINSVQLPFLQEAYDLACSLIKTNLQLLTIASNFLPVVPVSGHFTTLRTKIRDPQLLILALEQLGLMVALEADVRGWNGQTIKADVVAVLEGDYDIGWLRNADGSFDLIADLWGVAQTYNQTELITSINRQYEQNASLM